MKKENSSNQKKNNNFLAAAVSLILSAALFAVDLFLLLNQPRNFIGLIGTTLLMLIWIYFFVRSIFQELEQNKQVMTSYLEAMLKSEKAFFLMQRKVLNEMQQFGEDAKLPSEEIITAQKAIAKVTINRSRENTDALMNSNNQLLDRLADFEDKLSSFHSDTPMQMPTPEPIERPDPMIENSVRDILTEQRMIVENMQRMEAAIKDEVLKAVNSINEMQSKMPVYVQEPVRQEVNVSLEDELNRGITLESVSSTDADFAMTQTIAPEVFPAEEVPTVEMPIEETVTGSDIGAPEDIVVGEDIGAPEDIIIDGAVEAPEDIVVGEDIGAPEDIIIDGAVEVPEDIVVGEDIGAPEDIIIDGDIGSMPLADSDIGASAPVEEELPDLDSLLSSIENLGITEEVPETISEPIAEIEPEPVSEPEPEPVEEKPVMPELSNPSKMMTPDEIAALLANM